MKRDRLDGNLNCLLLFLIHIHIFKYSFLMPQNFSQIVVQLFYFVACSNEEFPYTS